MVKPPGNMTIRVVPLHAREAGDATVGGTVAERLALVARLRETSWALGGRPLPTYPRATVTVVVTTLRAHSGST